MRVFQIKHRLYINSNLVAPPQAPGRQAPAFTSRGIWVEPLEKFQLSWGED